MPFLPFLALATTRTPRRGAGEEDPTRRLAPVERCRVADRAAGAELVIAARTVVARGAERPGLAPGATRADAAIGETVVLIVCVELRVRDRHGGADPTARFPGVVAERALSWIELRLANQSAASPNRLQTLQTLIPCDGKAESKSGPKARLDETKKYKYL